MITSKKFSLVLVMLSIINTTGSANEETSINNSPEKPKKETTFVVEKKLNQKKRHVSLLRALWNNTQFTFGFLLFTNGVVIAPSSIAVASGLIKDFKIIPYPVLITTGVASPLFIYLGYKIMQNSYDSTRDEYVESYFGTPHPSQMKYHAEAESE